MSLFNHEHGFPWSDEDEETLNVLYTWNGSFPLPNLSVRQVDKLVKDLLRAMDMMGEQRSTALDKRIVDASAALWAAYRDAQQKGIQWLKLYERSLSKAA